MITYSKKSITSLVVIVLMLFSILPVSASEQLSDIKGHWAEESIREWQERGLVKGHGDGTFKPSSSITRAEFAAMVNRAFGLKEQAEIDFPDVSKGAWYYDDIAKAVAAGYIQGDGDGSMSPRRGITRQEVAMILFRLLELEEVSADVLEDFSDYNSVADWSLEAVKAVVDEGIIQGHADGTLRPRDLTTRAETVVILDRVVGELYNEAGTYGPEEDKATIAGNVTVTEADITLQNMTIEGNLFLSAGIGDGDVTLKNITVEGRTVIAGGGEDSIHLVDTNLGRVIVNRRDRNVRIVFSGSSKAATVSLRSSGKVENNTEENIGTVEVQTKKEVSLAGNFETVRLNSENSAVNIERGTVERLEVSELAKDSSVKTTAETIVRTAVLEAPSSVTGEGQITRAIITAPSTIEREPEESVVKEGVTANVGGKEVEGDKTAEDIEKEKKTETEDDSDETGGETDTSPGSGGPSSPSKTSVTAVGIDGYPVVGELLTAKPTPSGTTGNYQWQRAEEEDGTYADIEGATESTYELDEEDAGKWIKVKVTGTGSYTGTRTSEPVGPVGTVSKVELSLSSGETGETGETTVISYIGDNYIAKTVIPKDAEVDAESVTIEFELKDIESLGLSGIRTRELTVNTGVSGFIVPLASYIGDFYRL